MNPSIEIIMDLVQKNIADLMCRDKLHRIASLF
jgi:hypothetical protein